ncbi:MAG: hypothetical protein JXA42_25665, partial [Anaerolineales bacterium]|nr:hypothetical protein [Anaerolineales bacterium]
INMVKMISPEFARIIEQGVKEGVFSTDYVEESAEIALSILQTFSDALADMLINPDRYDDPMMSVGRQIAAIETAIERVLGAAEGSLPLVDAGSFSAWFDRNAPAMI